MDPRSQESQLNRCWTPKSRFKAATYALLSSFKTFKGEFQMYHFSKFCSTIDYGFVTLACCITFPTWWSLQLSSSSYPYYKSLRRSFQNMSTLNYLKLLPGGGGGGDVSWLMGRIAKGPNGPPRYGLWARACLRLKWTKQKLKASLQSNLTFIKLAFI